MRVRLSVAACLMFCFLLCIAGCHPKNAATDERRFPLEGRVVAVDAATHTLTIAHHEIPGYMQAMTMGFTVRDAWVFNVVHPGDNIQATLVVGADDYLESISITQSRTAADTSSTSPVHLPETGEAVPDFHFLNQNGRPIHLAQFRGQPLLLTFIYSRCPLPDYCPRMSNNFAELARTLQQSSPAAFAKLQMLTITLDPEYDTPKVLLAYGKTYAGAVDPSFKHWSFATASPDDIRKAATFFGLSYETQSGQIIHNLRTSLIDADGKVAELFTDNQWKPADVAVELQHLQR